MNLAQRIAADITTALKAHDAATVDVLRFLKSSLHNAQIAKQADLTDADVEKVVASEVKRRAEAVEQFRAGGREELAAADSAAIAVLKAYLPQSLTEAEVEAVVRAQVDATGAHGPADFGKVMGSVMAQVGTRADGKVVQAMVKRILTPSRT